MVVSIASSHHAPDFPRAFALPCVLDCCSRSLRSAQRTLSKTQERHTQRPLDHGCVHDSRLSQQSVVHRPCTRCKQRENYALRLQCRVTVHKNDQQDVAAHVPRTHVFVHRVTCKRSGRVTCKSIHKHQCANVRMRRNQERNQVCSQKDCSLRCGSCLTIRIIDSLAAFFASLLHRGGQVCDYLGW